MNWQEALELLRGHRHHLRYAELCSNDNADSESRDAYRRLVIRKAGGHSHDLPGYTPAVVKAAIAVPSPTRPTPAMATLLLKQMKACAFRSTDPPCGCSGAWCSLRQDQAGRRPSIVSHHDCFDCLRRYPETTPPA